MTPPTPPPPPPSSPRLARRVVFELAVAADCDPRSVERVVRGERVRERVKARIERAAKEIGITIPTASGQ